MLPPFWQCLLSSPCQYYLKHKETVYRLKCLISPSTWLLIRVNKPLEVFYSTPTQIKHQLEWLTVHSIEKQNAGNLNKQKIYVLETMNGGPPIPLKWKLAQILLSDTCVPRAANVLQKPQPNIVNSSINFQCSVSFIELVICSVDGSH